MLKFDLNSLVAYDFQLHRPLFKHPSVETDLLAWCDLSGSAISSVYTYFFLIRFRTPWAIRWNGCHRGWKFCHDLAQPCPHLENPTGINIPPRQAAMVPMTLRSYRSLTFANIPILALFRVSWWTKPILFQCCGGIRPLVTFYLQTEVLSME